MKSIYKNGLFMMALGALAVSCADYNVTDNFTVGSEGAYNPPYGEYGPVKSYIDKEKYPNMTVGAALSTSDFKAQGMIHAVAVTNFDNVALGSGLMSGKFMKANGVKDFTDMIDVLEHVDNIGYDIYGSPIAANANQADEWFNRLTSPIQIYVEYIQGKKVDYNTMTQFTGTTVSGTKGSIEKKEGVNSLKIANRASVNIIEDFDVDPLAKYTISFTALTEAAGGNASFSVNFCGKKIDGVGANGTWTFGAGGWRTVIIENVKCPEDATKGYLTIENTRSGVIYVADVEMGYYPDDHREQTETEVSDTINYALNTWCDALMETNASRIKSFDLIDEPIDSKSELEDGLYDLKHSTSKIFWQDIFGSENYGPKVSKAARAAYEKHGGNASDLKLFVSETGLDDVTKMKSLKHWIDVWEQNGAKIDGINAKMNNLYYSENADSYAANKKAFDTLLDELIATGKLIRLSNLDIRYRDAEDMNVSGTSVTDEQRQNLADYYSYIIRSYMTKVPTAQQAGISKSNLVDAGDAAGLWVKTRFGNKEDWVRTCIYKAWCDALSGK